MRLIALIASGALLLAAPAFAQTAPAAEEAPAAAAPAPAPTPDAATPAPEADADPVVCRDVQRVGSRLRSQRDRYCARQSVWDGEAADTRERFDRVNTGQSIPSPTGRGGLE